MEDEADLDRGRGAIGSVDADPIREAVRRLRVDPGSPVDAPAVAHPALQPDQVRSGEEAEVDALKSIRDLSKELGIVPNSTLASRERAELLLRALRDYDDPRSRFAGTAEEIQRHVPRADMERVEREYREWVERYYPSKITKADRAEIKHEAVGK